MLAAGALLSPAWSPIGWFVGEGWAHFWGGSIVVTADRARSLHAHARGAGLGEAGCRWSLALIGLGARLRTSTSSVPALPARDRARVQAALHASSTTSGTSTSSMTALFVQPALAIGGVLLEGRRRRHHRRARARRRRRARARIVAGVLSRLQTGYRLPLRLRDADRRRGAGQLVLHAVREVATMASWPILSARHLPAAGRRALFMPARPRRRRRSSTATAAASRCGPRWSTFLLSLLLWVDFDPTKAGFQFVEKVAWIAGAQHQLPHGRRRHLAAVRPAVDPPDADLHPGELGADRRPGSRNT